MVTPAHLVKVVFSLDPKMEYDPSGINQQVLKTGGFNLDAVTHVALVHVCCGLKDCPYPQSRWPLMVFGPAIAAALKSTFVDKNRH